MKPRIKLGFCDFWPRFDARDNYFTRLLAARFEVEISERAEFLIYSCFGRQHRRHRGIRIFYAGENHRPDFSACDYAFSFDHLEHPDHYRLPLYALYFAPEQLVKPPFDPERVLAAKTGFCNFVYSNSKGRERIEFFHKLSKYKRVDSGGRLLNNIGGPVPDKMQFIRNYKFTIAFENASHPGYTTEKLAEPMAAMSLPIYWGNPVVERDFNPRSFINAADGASLDDLVERVVELDRDDARYCEMLRQPWYHDYQANQYIDPANVLAQFERIFSAGRTPIAQKSRRRWFFSGVREAVILRARRASKVG